MAADRPMVGRRGGEVVADYRHEPAAIVPLAFPFVLLGREIARLALSPPTYGDLERLRQAEPLAGPDILAALTGELPPVIRALRWPDMEAALAAGLDLLPPDLVARIAGGGEPEAEPAAEPAVVGVDVQADSIATDTGPVEPGEAPPDVGAELGLRPEDFMTAV